MHLCKIKWPLYSCACKVEYCTLEDRNEPHGIVQVVDVNYKDAKEIFGVLTQGGEDVTLAALSTVSVSHCNVTLDCWLTLKNSTPRIRLHT